MEDPCMTPDTNLDANSDQVETSITESAPKTDLDANSDQVETSITESAPKTNLDANSDPVETSITESASKICSAEDQVKIEAKTFLEENKRLKEELQRIKLENEQLKLISEPELGRKLFIGSLSENTTEETLRKHFEKWGEIVYCVVRNTKTKGLKTKKFGFITYKSACMFDAAQAAGPHKIDGCEVVTNKYIQKPTKPENKVAVKKIYVDGLRNVINEEDLKQYFSKYGNIISVKGVDSTTGQRIGAYLEFDDCAPVDEIMSKQHRIKDKMLRVQKELSRQKMEKIKRKKEMIKRRKEIRRRTMGINERRNEMHKRRRMEMQFGGGRNDYNNRWGADNYGSQASGSSGGLVPVFRSSYLSGGPMRNSGQYRSRDSGPYGAKKHYIKDKILRVKKELPEKEKKTPKLTIKSKKEMLKKKKEIRKRKRMDMQSGGGRNDYNNRWGADNYGSQASGSSGGRGFVFGSSFSSGGPMHSSGQFPIGVSRPYGDFGSSGGQGSVFGSSGGQGSVFGSSGGQGSVFGSSYLSGGPMYDCGQYPSRDSRPFGACGSCERLNIVFESCYPNGGTRGNSGRYLSRDSGPFGASGSSGGLRSVFGSSYSSGGPMGNSGRYPSRDSGPFGGGYGGRIWM